MHIKKLIIRNTITNEKIRSVVFRQGANFIVDTSNSKQHNKVGKTTFLRLIDIVLGANERKNIYFDSETGSVEQKVDEFISENKITAEMTVSSMLAGKEEEHILEVGLYKRGPYKINGNKFNKPEYINELNELFFDNTSKPTFRQLIKSFVRISMRGDNASFLKNLTHTSFVEYRMVYDYLFNIGDQNIGQKRDELSKDLSSLKSSKARFKNVQNINDIGALNQVIQALKSDKKDITDKLNNIVSSDYFIKNKIKIDDVRKKYTELNRKISKLNYQQKLNLLEIGKLDDDKRQVDKNIEADFFNEVNELIPNINKTFNDLVNFNKKLIENKREYLKNIINKNSDNLNALEADKKKLVTENKNFIALIQDDRIDDYNTLMNELSQRDKEISDREAMKTALTNYDKKIETIKQELDELPNVDDYENKMTSFNKYFMKYAQQINGERPVLTYIDNLNKFPLEINKISGTSTGTRKSLIAAYDLAYQSFAAEQNKIIPNFIIHDVMENIESDNLLRIVQLAESTKTQYIVAILQENLSLALEDDKEKEKYEILKLSDTDKLFKI